MSPLLCPNCGQPVSEFDLSCAGCGVRLPTETTRIGIPHFANGDPLVGRTVTHFQVLGKLGSGGMGVVYRAQDLELGREVALKLLAPLALGRPQDEARFLREARIAAALDHPNVGTVYEIGEHEGRRFLAMAFYDGETLAARLERSGSLPVAEAVAVTAQLASALAAAHEAGVVHRDLKPSNIQITRSERVKLLDFGLARHSEDPALTEGNVAVGTAAYISPERLRGEPGGPAADLWALGLILYEMLTGRRPFGGERHGMLHSILYEEPPPLRDLRPETLPVLERIVSRCLAKAPQERYSGAGEIVDELRAAGLWESGSTAVIPAPRRRAWSRRARVAAAVLTLAAGAAVLLPRMGKPEPPVYVAVLKPVISGTLSPADRAQVEANLQAALLRTVASLEGLAALDSAQVNAVQGPPREVARATAAGEVVAAQADCAGDMCQVSLRRLAGTDGHVLWSETLRLPVYATRLFAEAVAAALRQGYSDRDLLVDRLELRIEERDYRTFLQLRQRLAEPEASYQEILSRLADLQRQAPSFLEAYVQEAKVAERLYLDTGDARYLERGRAVAKQAFEMAPEDPRPLGVLFSLALSAGDLEQAETALKRMEALDPAGSLLRRGQLAERRGRPDEALARMKEAALLQPSWQTLLTVANAEYRLGRLEDARRHLEELLERFPGNLEGLQTLAQIELLRNPDRAVTLLREAARRTPDAGTLTNLGVSLLLLRRYGEAEKSLRRALELEPDSPSAALNLADVLFLLGRDEEAHRLYRRAAAGAERMATPGDWQLLSVKAQALAHLGETVHAVQAVQQALRLTPDNAQLAFEAAVVYAVLGDRGSAIFHAQQAADRGVDASWFALPFFDTLRGDSAFQALSSSQVSDPS